MKKIGIVGIGRVGLPFALFLETLGFEVIGIDKDKNLLGSLRDRIMPFEEPGCRELLKNSRSKFTDDISEVNNMDFMVITVGTPLLPHIETDLSNVEHVLRTMVPHIHKGQCLVLRSTVAPRTTQYVKTFLETETKLKVGEDIGLAFCPERLAEHKALDELKKLPQVIGCEDDLSFKMAHEMFTRFGVKIFRSSYISAELTKLYNNAARYIEFAVANQFAIYAHQFGQNIYEILQLANEDYPRGFIYKPGLTAGTCLRKDFGMINELSSGPDLLLAAWKINEFMPYHLTELAARLTNLNDKNIAILGYTFKSNSDDVRDSLVPKLIRYLERHVPRTITICEPNLKDKEIGKYKNVELKDSLKNADVVFIAVNHDPFKDAKMIMDNIKNGTVVIDIWNCMKRNQVAYKKETT